jgi:glycosyltransferase involved in cell wall biosynthesis
MIKKPMISIGLPVYNGENYIAEAIESVLSQTCRDFELIISDNASIDKTQEICELYAQQDPRIRYVRHPVNVGAAGNFNYTVEVASGMYFVWIAHDDKWCEKYLAACVNILEADTSIVLCFANTNFINSNGGFISKHQYPLDAFSDNAVNRYLHMIDSRHIVVEVFGLIRIEVLRATRLIGSYTGSDLVLLGELLLHGRFYQVPEVLFLHREHVDRSVKKHADIRSREKWFDSDRKVIFILPLSRMMFEHGKSIFRVRLNLPTRLKLIVSWLRVLYWRKWEVVNEVKNCMSVGR